MYLFPWGFRVASVGRPYFYFFLRILNKSFSTISMPEKNSFVRLQLRRARLGKHSIRMDHNVQNIYSFRTDHKIKIVHVMALTNRHLRETLFHSRFTPYAWQLCSIAFESTYDRLHELRSSNFEYFKKNWPIYVRQYEKSSSKRRVLNNFLK